MSQPRTPEQIYEEILAHKAQRPEERFGDHPAWVRANAAHHAIQAALIKELSDAAGRALSTPTWACWAIACVAADARFDADWWRRQSDATDGAEAEL
jgi:hypothetical protein